MALDEFTWCTQTQGGGGAMATENNDREVSFGNGYKQVASSGFNTVRRVYTVVYAGTDYKKVLEFMHKHRLKPFLWVAPDGVLGLYRVKSGSVGSSPVSATVQEAKATFEEQFTSMR